jgi:hypothetical protein
LLNSLVSLSWVRMLLVFLSLFFEPPILCGIRQHGLYYSCSLGYSCEFLLFLHWLPLNFFIMWGDVVLWR